MLEINDKSFEKIVAEAIDQVPPKYLKRMENVAFVIEDEPDPAQRQQLKLKDYETLFGLYEGAPLPSRMGQTKMLPDKITIFKKPLIAVSRTLEDLKLNVGHTIWHEVAHYFGLDHDRIDQLDERHRHRG